MLKERRVSATQRTGRAGATVLISLLVSLFAVSARANEILRFVTLEFEPFIYGEDQQVAGPGRDVIAEVCRTADIACTFDIYPWRRAQELIRSGDADGMMVIGRNAGREDWLRFSPPMFRTEYGFFFKAGNTAHFSDISQLSGYRVGVFAPSNTATQLENIRTEMLERGLAPIEIDAHPNDSAGLRKLAAGRVDAVYSNRDRGRGIIRAEALEDQIRYAGVHQEILYYAGITKDYPKQEVVEAFFTAWRGLFQSGKAQEIILNYGLEPAKVN
jgi:polar amino acid transport system substrate-binding protein